MSVAATPVATSSVSENALQSLAVLTSETRYEGTPGGPLHQSCPTPPGEKGGAAAREESDGAKNKRCGGARKGDSRGTTGVSEEEERQGGGVERAAVCDGRGAEVSSTGKGEFL